MSNRILNNILKRIELIRTIGNNNIPKGSDTHSNFDHWQFNYEIDALKTQVQRLKGSKK